jgi:hypothetical protein
MVDLLRSQFFMLYFATFHELTQKPVAGPYEHGNEPRGSKIVVLQFLDQPRDCHLLRKGSARWIHEFIEFISALT